MIEQATKLGVLGAIGVAVVGLSVFVVGYSVVTGSETETTQLFAQALAGPGVGGILVAVGRFFGGSDS